MTHSFVLSFHFANTYCRCFICFIVLCCSLVSPSVYAAVASNSRSNHREYAFNIPFAVLSTFSPSTLLILYTIPAKSFLRPMPCLHAETHRKTKCATVYCKLLGFHGQSVYNLVNTILSPPRYVIQHATSQTLFRLLISHRQIQMPMWPISEFTQCKFVSISR